MVEELFLHHAHTFGGYALIQLIPVSACPIRDGRGLRQQGLLQG